MAPVDLEALGARIAATVERAKADDPRALRARVTDLEKQLATRPQPKVEYVNPIWLHHDGLKWTQEVRSHI